MQVPRRMRATALLGAAAAIGLVGAVALATAPAHAEASAVTATLTVTGVRDSNCPVSTGGTTVYVRPGGTVTFRADLAGISVQTPLGMLPLSSSLITSFDERLVIDGDATHAHHVNGSHKYVLSGARGTHRIAWSAQAVRVNIPATMLAPSRSLKIVLGGRNVFGVPAGGKLDWMGKIVATSASATCGIAAQLPGGASGTSAAPQSPARGTAPGDGLAVKGSAAAQTVDQAKAGTHLPTLLALAAILALALVTGAYARLLLRRRDS